MNVETKQSPHFVEVKYGMPFQWKFTSRIRLAPRSSHSQPRQSEKISVSEGNGENAGEKDLILQALRQSAAHQKRRAAKN